MTKKFIVLMEYSDGKKYGSFRKEEQLRKTQIIFSELGDKKTLDAGCGTGISSSLFSDIIGVDPSTELLKENPYPHIRGKAENLPFKDNEFENVICITAIHNFDDIDKGLEEIKRVGTNFGFSVMKKSAKFKEIKTKIKKLFKIKKEIDEGIDEIFICEKEQTTI
jgi:ubiquinone/menaquinone biosynthesis C-methylase UbiE